MKWLHKLERKFGRYAIKDLMTYIVVLNAVVYLLSILVPESNLFAKFVLIPSQVLKGEVWRLITFIFLPPNTSPLWIVFTLYFYYMVGSNLENEWGSFRFNIYYLIGMLATIAAAFITGSPVTAVHLNLSLLLAFAYLFPNFEILIFFILPVKVKYLGYLNWAFVIFSIVFYPLAMKLSAIASVINYFIFFGSDLIRTMKSRKQTYQNRKRFNQAFKNKRD